MDPLAVVTAVLAVFERWPPPLYRGHSGDIVFFEQWIRGLGSRAVGAMPWIRRLVEVVAAFGLDPLAVVTAVLAVFER